MKLQKTDLKLENVQMNGQYAFNTKKKYTDADDNAAFIVFAKAHKELFPSDDYTITQAPFGCNYDAKIEKEDSVIYIELKARNIEVKYKNMYFNAQKADSLNLIKDFYPTNKKVYAYAVNICPKIAQINYAAIQKVVSSEMCLVPENEYDNGLYDKGKDKNLELNYSYIPDKWYKTDTVKDYERIKTIERHYADANKQELNNKYGQQIDK